MTSTRYISPRRQWWSDNPDITECFVAVGELTIEELEKKGFHVPDESPPYSDYAGAQDYGIDLLRAREWEWFEIERRYVLRNDHLEEPA